MNYKKVISTFAVGVGILAIAIILGSFHTVLANPLYLSNGVVTSSATTSQSTVGLYSTSTILTYDSYASSTSLAEGAVFLLQLTPSSTTAFNMEFEYSNDSIDWYKDEINIGATTSPSYNITNYRTYNFTAPSTATATRAIRLLTPTRYVRAIGRSTTGTSTLWAQFVPVKQSK